jgi:hypothetical protein
LFLGGGALVFPIVDNSVFQIEGDGKDDDQNQHNPPKKEAAVLLLVLVL